MFGDAGDANLRQTCFGNWFLAMPAMQIYDKPVLETGFWRCRRCTYTKNLFWKLVFCDVGDANLRKTCLGNWFLAMPAMQFYEKPVL